MNQEEEAPVCGGQPPGAVSETRGESRCSAAVPLQYALEPRKLLVAVGVVHKLK